MPLCSLPSSLCHVFEVLSRSFVVEGGVRGGLALNIFGSWAVVCANMYRSDLLAPRSAKKKQRAVLKLTNMKARRCTVRLQSPCARVCISRTAVVISNALGAENAARRQSSVQGVLSFELHRAYCLCTRVWPVGRNELLALLYVRHSPCLSSRSTPHNRVWSVVKTSGKVNPRENVFNFCARN